MKYPFREYYLKLVKFSI